MKKRMIYKGLRKLKGHILRIILLLFLSKLVLFNVIAQDILISINMNNVSLGEILKEIKNQSDKSILFNNNKIDQYKQESINIENAMIDQALNEVLKGKDLQYRIVDGVIIIEPKSEIQKNEIPEPDKLTQTVKGKVTDKESLISLPGANVIILGTQPLLGGVTDFDGDFKIENVPIGRYNIQVSYIGYEPVTIPEILIGSAKEVVLNLSLKESITSIDELVITVRKDKPQNSMATISARTFSVEEARRYAGGFDDPARLAASFAGITTENTRDNTIVIRGNSPKGLLWRLEGVAIGNPNHFANLGTFGGGGVSALSALVIGDSDFFTGAFPAEYGNATSGVFDIKLRTGNSDKHEHAIQIGTIGIDFSSEGPLKKNSKASYLFNYRYSTMGLVKELFPEDLKTFIPAYQDLCFKINLPTKEAGIFSIWGLALNNKSTMPALEDTLKWETFMNRLDNDVSQSMGAIGFNHRYIFQKNAWLNTSLAITGDYMKYEDNLMDFDLNLYDYNDINFFNYKYTLSSVYNHKFSAKHNNRAGFVIDNMHYDMDIKFAPVLDQGLISISDEANASNIIQIFSQSKYNISNKILVNAGIHGHYFDLNEEFVIEPRFGLTYNLNQSQSLSFGYGKHSRIEPLSLYFARVNESNIITQPNTDLKVSKAHHLVLAYDISLNSNLRLKIEPYFQYLYDVPVIPDSNFSVLNLEMEWYNFNSELINTGTGKNMGIDFTLERFLSKGYYYLITASFFDSKFKGDDGIEHNTRFNTNYVINLLYGKEWILGKHNNKILGINAKINFFGGKRLTPVNQDQSFIEKDVVYFNSRLFEDKEPNKFHVNTTINYRINKKNHASIWSLKMMNLFLAKESYGYFYNYKEKKVLPWEIAVPVPNLSYKIEF